MAGVREKNRVQTEAAIIEAALELFTTQGFGATTVEQVAERAVVAVGTVYNYFGSKDGLLVALILRDHHELHEEGRQMVAQPSRSAERAVIDLLWIYVEGFWSKHPRPLMREMLTISFANIESVGQHMRHADLELIAQIVELLERLQEQGKVATSLPAELAAQVLYSSLMTLFIIYAMDEELALDSVRKMLSDYVRLIFRDWRSS